MRRILRVLDQPYATTTKLARHLTVTRPSVSRALHAMARSGLVARTKQGWELTSEGQKEVEAMTYEFTFSALTIGDYLALVKASAANDIDGVLQIADRYTVGGALNLPFTELQPYAEQFSAAFTRAASGPAWRLVQQALEKEPDL